MSSEQQQRIMGYFIEEAKDHLNTIEQGLLNLQGTIEDPDLISEVFRAAHSVKGGAAMLGIDSVQHMSHRLEDFFKTLKDHPVRVDRTSESLFLQVFDALKALIEQMQGPFGLTDQSAEDIVHNVTPVVEELQNHLNQLLRSGEAVSAQSPTSAEINASATQTAQTAAAVRRFFQAEVPERLRQMLQRFKQPDSDEGRSQLDRCCEYLLTSPDADLPVEWRQLVDHVQRAIADPANSYRQLAPTVIKNLKRAQERAVAGQSQSIEIGDDLRALVPLTEASAQASIVQDSELDLLLAEVSTEASSDDAMADLFDTADAPDENDAISGDAFESNAFKDGLPEDGTSEDSEPEVLDLFADPDAELTDVNVADIDGLADLFESDLETAQPPQPVSPSPDEAASEAQSDDELSFLLGMDDADAGDTPDVEAIAPNPEPELEPELEPDIEIDAETTQHDELSALLEGSEPQADQLVSAIADTADSDLDELFGDLLSDDGAELGAGGDAVQMQPVEAVGSAEPESDRFASESEAQDYSDLSELFAEAPDLEPSSDDRPAQFSEEATEAGALDLLLDEPGSASEPDQFDALFDSAGETDEAGETNETSGVPESQMDSLLDEFGVGEASLGETGDGAGEIGSDEAGVDDFLSAFDANSDEGAGVDAASSAVAGEDIADFDLESNSESDGGDLDDIFASSENADDALSDLFEDGQADVVNLEPGDDALSALFEDEQADADLDTADSGLSDGSSVIEADSAAQDSIDLDLFADISEGDEPDGSAASAANILDDISLENSAPEDSALGDSASQQPTSEELSDFEPDDLTSGDAASGMAQTLHVTGSDPESELDFDISTVNVTDDLWNEEAGERWMDALISDADAAGTDALDNSDSAEGAERPFDDTDIQNEAALSAELSDSGLDQMFGDLEPLPDTFSESQPAAGAEPGDLRFGAGSLSLDAPGLEADVADAPPETETLQDVSSSSEESDGAVDAEQFDALFTDFSGEPEADGSASPFNLDDLMTADGDETAAPEVGDRSLEGLDNFGEEALSDQTAESSVSEAESPDIDESEFDDLLSIGASEPAEAAERASDDSIDLPLDRDDGDSSPAASDSIDDPAQSDFEPYRTDQEAGVFSDLDALLGSPDADIQSDLLPATDIDSPLEADAEEPYDLTETDLPYAESPFGTIDQIEAAIQNLEGGEQADGPTLDYDDQGPQNADDFADLEKLLEQADETLGGNPVPSTALRLSSQGRRPARRPTLGNQTMRVSVKNLDNLNNLVGELVVNRNSLEQSQDRLRQFLDNLMSQVQQLGDLGQRIRDLYERSLLESSLRSSRPQQSAAFIPEADATHVTGARFDALEMDRFTGFHSLSQEIIELIVRVREAASDIDFIVDESEQGTRILRQITTQLQEGINHTRMVPFAQAADRLPRAVRDISVKFNKQAELVVEGRDTLVDKMILEQLYDPMTHLVNNAITHGIELPEARTAAGKSPVGQITVRAFHQGNQTIISVTDDGAGIDAEQVKQKAQQRGLISPQEAGAMTQLDTYDLLFHHGFSTRDQADDFAGRGVGMDVVRTSLSEVRGTINIDSTVGKGTTFTIRLPLTLSISKALLCVSDRARIAFPMDGVEDMFDIAQERVEQNEAGQTCVPWRDTMLPFRPLSNLLKFNRTIGRGSVYGGSQDDDMISIVVLRSTGNYLALQVDQVLEEREIVIKQLEPPVPKPAGIAGATVLGDGRVMPITDVLELVDLSLGRSRRDMVREEEPPIEVEATEAREPTVLIVDDSITVRELLSMTFAKVGYRVEQARDGQEAWEKLKSGLPCDLVFCDIEMPRMDGLELLSRLQRDSDLEALPVAMLTSRGADRHRQMAVDLGAKGYFTKPYLEEALLEAAQRMLAGEALVAKVAKS
ncbi:MAG: response regulator [Elainellaceae cyanobacterium]